MAGLIIDIVVLIFVGTGLFLIGSFLVVFVVSAIAFFIEEVGGSK